MEVTSKNDYYDKSGEKTILYYVVFLMGIFVTMPIVALRVFGIEESVFEILFIITIGLLIINQKNKLRIKIFGYSKKLIIWLVLSVCSCLIGWIYFSFERSDFSKAAFSYIPKIILFLLFLILWTNQSDLDSQNKALLKGILVGCILNLAWSILDAAGYYITGRSINNILFYSYAVRHKIHFNAISITRNGMIRSSGFNYDPAHLGFIAPFVMGYGVKKKNVYLIVLSLLGVVSSASTTALVSSILIALVNIDFKNMRFRLTKKTMILGFAVFVAIVAGFYFWGSRISSIIHIATNNFFGRVSDQYLSSQGDNLRMRYLKLFPKALINLGPLMFFGTGFGSASYGYVSDASLLDAIGSSNNFAYDMENTYLAYLFDTGIVGFLAFFTLMFSLLRIFKKKSNEWINSELYTLIAATLLSMLFYHYVLYSVQMLAIIAAVSMADNLKKVEFNT